MLRGTPVVVTVDDFAPRSNNQFTGKLVLRHLKADVEDLRKITAEILEGITQPIEETDKRIVNAEDKKTNPWTEDREMRALATVKQLLTRLKEEHEVLETRLERSVCTVSYMKRIGRNVGPIVGMLKEARTAFKVANDKAPRIEEKMKPLIKKNAVKMRAIIAKAKIKLEAFGADVASRSPVREC